MSLEGLDSFHLLTPVQHGMLFHTLAAPNDGVYVDQFTIDIDGGVEAGALERAWQMVVDRHAALRTSFHWEGLDAPLQVVHHEARARIAVEDWNGLPPAEHASRLAELVARDRRRGFDVRQPPLVRLTLLRRAAPACTLLLTTHHVILDGWSCAVIERELVALYRAIRTGVTAGLEPPVPFRAYLSWHRQQDPRGVETFWRECLRGFAPRAYLPRHGAAERADAPAMQERRLSTELTSRVRQFARARRLTVSTLVGGAWAVLLARYAGEREVAYGLTVNGRPEALPGIERLVGNVINTLPVRLRIDPAERVVEWLARVQAQHLDLQPVAHASLTDIKRWAGLTDERPLFDTILAIENLPRDEGPAAADAGLGVRRSRHLFRTNYPLALEVLLDPDLAVRAGYDRSALRPSMVARLLAQLERLLESFVDAPEQPVGAAPHLTRAEQHQIQFEWNDTRAEYPHASIPDVFEAQAGRTPDATALLAGDGAITYAALNADANRCARFLGRMARPAETAAAVVCADPASAVVGTLAVLKAGWACVPLEPDDPPGRLAALIERSGAAVVLCDRAVAARLPPSGAARVLLDEPDRWRHEDAGNPSVPIHPDRLAYVMHTSGSTGEPKGVEVCHRGILRLLFGGSYVSLARSDVLLQLSRLSFDASFFELWGALLTGAACALAPARALAFPALGSLIRRHRVTTMWLTASLFNAIVDDDAAMLAGVDQLLVGGEALSERHLARARAALPRARIVNGYGPTEGTTFTTCYRIPGDWPADAQIPLGRPIGNTRAYVLGLDVHPAPVGCEGEIYAAGEGLARGYRAAPGLTAERFLPDPFGAAGARMYRTGDRGRYRPDGTIEFLGRRDEQAKIRGFRVEPGEVESVLARHPAVLRAVVVPRGTPRPDRLSAFLVLRPGSDWRPEELDRWLRATLPDYMIPAEWSPIDDVPLTPNGKIDRRSLVETGRASLPIAGDRMAPRTPIEELLAHLWADVLGVPAPGVFDDFLALGGHSLAAIRLVSRLREAFDVDIPLPLVFEAPTVSEQAAHVERRLRESGPARPPLGPGIAGGGPSPLSFAQERMWILDQFDPGPAYHVPLVVALTGPLDADALWRSLREIVRRHEALRTTFRVAGDAVVQAVNASADLRPALIDLTGLPESDREAELRRIGEDEVAQRFDLSQGPLLRARLVRLGAESHVALVTMHHIVSDAWSLEIFVRELEALYGAQVAGSSAALPMPAVQYRDYARWQREWLRDDVLRPQIAYWRERLAGCPRLALPVDRPRAAIQRYRGERVARVLPPAAAASVAALAREERATPFMVLCAAFVILLHRWTGQSDFAIGTPIANRGHVEIERLIGFFVNTLVLRMDVTPGASVRDVLARVRREALAAYAHSDVPFEKLVAELQPARDLASTPFFQAMFVFDGARRPPIVLGPVTGVPLPVRTGTAKFEITMAVRETGEGLEIGIEYNCDLFHRTTMQRALAHYARLIEAAVATPEATVADLPLLTPAERHHVRVEWNATAGAEAAADSVVARWERQVSDTPGAVALEYAGERWSYAELNRRANRWARALRARGVGPEVCVGLWLERTADLVTALLAVLKAGGAYVPLDPTYPAGRLAAQMAASRVALVLGPPDGDALAGAPAMLAVGSDPDEADTNVAGTIDPDQLAYVLTTSGSTGVPKAVGLTHRGAASLLTWAGRQYTPAALGGVLASTALGFDLSVFELLAPLTHGGRAILVDSVLELAGLGAGARVRLVNTVPSALAAIVRSGGLPAGVQVVNLAGEVLDCSLVDDLHARGVREVWNLYGPTEDTTYSTAGRVPPGATGAAAIGRPLPGKEVYVVDPAGELAPMGAIGELYLGGAGLARGYVGQPAATAERWVPHPWSARPGARLYRTGDRARWRADGSLEFVGRTDQQVKLRGYRIELGDVEAAVRGIAIVRDAVVQQESHAGQPRLVAYVSGDPACSPADLAELAARRLPPFMVPAEWVVLAELPRLPNGKVDRAALRRTAADPAAASRAGVAPRTELERRIARIWQDVLRVPDVGAHDNFFSTHGGHSLLTIQVVARLREELGCSIPVIRIFEFPTVSALARHLTELGETGVDARAPGDAAHERSRARQESLLRRREAKSRLRDAGPVR